MASDKDRKGNRLDWTKKAGLKNAGLDKEGWTQERWTKKAGLDKEGWAGQRRLDSMHTQEPKGSSGRRPRVSLTKPVLAKKSGLAWTQERWPHPRRQCWPQEPKGSSGRRTLT
ncbi:hypothetical protein Ddc_22849 [Ditylenchus destructor]|nr:hypothetical protein Ddc_22849 [Ditylenchus destructor]